MVFLAMLVTGTLSGCAQDKGLKAVRESPKDEYTLGKSLLVDIFSAYRNYTRGSFDEFVSRDFSPIRSDFINGVERGFYAARQIDLYPIVDSVVTTGDLMSVTFHWEKKVSTYAKGDYKNLTGSAEYVFRKESGAWKIYQVKGDDPMVMN
jgi:hypothetical protein